MFSSAKLWTGVFVGALAFSVAAKAEPQGYYAIGTTPTAAQIAQWSIAIKPDGSNLPPGSGTVDQGSDVYGNECAACHGTFGEGVAAYPKLVGGVGSLKTQKLKTVGSYWPYAPIVFDYINRAMPFFAPRSLTSDQVYGITAYILNLNGIVPDNFVANAKTLAAVKMPNRDGFNFKDPRPLTHDTRCMSNCAEPKSLVITTDASKSGITPRTTGPVDDMQSSTTN
jgi:cytochrome c